nr:hypothetical protein [uncultured Rhodopila sp.]
MRTIILPRRRALALAATGLTALAVGQASAAEESAAYVVDVSDVAVKVGEPAVMLATVRARDGYRILTAYNNRVIRLSSYDDGVVFENDMVPAKVEDRALIFPVALRAVKPGTHPINGLLRVGYIHGSDEMAMVSMRLIANVTATE